MIKKAETQVSVRLKIAVCIHTQWIQKLQYNNISAHRTEDKMMIEETYNNNKYTHAHLRYTLDVLL